MRSIKPNTIAEDLDGILEEIEVTTGGYLTQKRVLAFRSLEKVASSRFGERIDFFSDGQGNILTFHYGRSLSLEKTVLAIDYFPGTGEDELNKVLDRVTQEIRKTLG